jgi:Arc/MetJ-type ribon-helix-helix transcriptional regulator
MGRPSLGGRPVHVRLPDAVIEKIDGRVGKQKRSDFIRKAIDERLAVLSGVKVTRMAAGRPKPKPEVAEPVSASGDRGDHPDDGVLLAWVRAHPGCREREAADGLGWMPVRVAKAVGRLQLAGRVWYPQPGVMEAYGE